ncbi:MAG: hypothetical protein KC486_11730 [Myxococcales bacterium]|nr:hypothetical protein [Myxococcales bacterium]
MTFAPRLTTTLTTAFLGLGLTLTTGCFDTSGATNIEMRAAVGEIVAQGQAQAIENEITEITTSFTIGGGVQEVLQEIKAFLESQAPCSTVEIADSTLTMDFGTLDDNCTYNNHTYAGVVTIAVTVEADATVIDHTYADFSNGTITMNGTKEVTYSAQSRRVVTDYEFVNKDGDAVDTTSDRTQTLLNESEGLAGGIVINGVRAWTGQSGMWNLDIDDVEVRWVDPVPQSGVYSLVTPKDKTITMSFERVDADTIAVIVDGGRNTKTYHVTSTGQVMEQTEADA